MTSFMAACRGDARSVTSPRLERPETAFSEDEGKSTRVSRWTSLLYVVVALAAPVLVYSGPDVLSPSAPAIADAALHGRFTLHRQAKCVAKGARADRPAKAGGTC